MAHWLNKKLFAFIVFLLFSGISVSQQLTGPEPNIDDYKDPVQFNRFYKRRLAVGAWQINELKKGALVVRLKTDKMLIDALLKEGNRTMAEKKKMEILGVNYNISRAYRNKYDFSKVYFIYSSSSDSLLKGARSNIFLDSNLAVDPTITMTESFYLIAEPDYVYNSSIGFVREDSAKFQIEKGNPTTHASIVIKNKYGHQLKRPFPYASYGTPYVKNFFNVYIVIKGKSILYDVDGILGSSGKPNYEFEGKPLKLSIPKDFTYEVFSLHVQGLNSDLLEYYRENPYPESSKDFADAKLFMY